METFQCHILEHGCPLAFYSDRHGIFRVNAKDAQSGDGKTEFGRVAARLKTEPIHALTPQAKGRVERANQTLQDRLVKEMRLQNICSVEAANNFMPVFITSWNGRFAVAPRDKPSAHRLWLDTLAALDHALARHEERVWSKALTFSSAGKVLRQDRRPRHCATRGEGNAASLRCWRYERPLQRPVATGHGLRDLYGP